ncbi:MAG: hypothetical protein GY863_14120 [bacterium]|nr:hypothetical protein [bacterium]
MKFRISRIGIEKGFASLLKKFHSSEKIRNQDEDESENRKFLRVYVQLPAILEIELPGSKPETFVGQVYDVSTGGVHLNFWIKKEFMKRLDRDREKFIVRYRFISPEQIAGDFIIGKIMRHISKLDKKKKLIELRLGVENREIPEVEKRKIELFINSRVIEAIDHDLEKMDKIKLDRELTDPENTLYTNLQEEKKNRSRDLNSFQDES